MTTFLEEQKRKLGLNVGLRRDYALYRLDMLAGRITETRTQPAQEMGYSEWVREERIKPAIIRVGALFSEVAGVIGRTFQGVCEVVGSAFKALPTFGREPSHDA